MGQCTYVNIELVKEYMKKNPHVLLETAMGEIRCKADSMKNHLRCKEHGGGDILHFFMRDMAEDEQERFIELFNNTIKVNTLDEGNLYIMNLVAMTCREIILSHNSEPKQMLEHIHNAVALGKELSATPKEQKGIKIEVKGDIIRDTEEITAVAKERLKAFKED